MGAYLGYNFHMRLICIEAATLTPWNMLHGHLPGSGHLPGTLYIMVIIIMTLYGCCSNANEPMHAHVPPPWHYYFYDAQCHAADLAGTFCCPIWSTEVNSNIIASGRRHSITDRRTLYNRQINKIVSFGHSVYAWSEPNIIRFCECMRNIILWNNGEENFIHSHKLNGCMHGALVHAIITSTHESDLYSRTHIILMNISY